MGDEELEYDSVLLVSFGGPEQRADVMPFLENVTKGKNVPPDRLKEVAAPHLRKSSVCGLNCSVK